MLLSNLLSVAVYSVIMFKFFLANVQNFTTFLIDFLPNGIISTGIYVVLITSRSAVNQCADNRPMHLTTSTA